MLGMGIAGLGGYGYLNFVELYSELVSEEAIIGVRK